MKGYIYLAAVIFWVASCTGSFFYGQHVRGLSAQVETGKQDLAVSKGETKAITEARVEDHGTQADVAKVEEKGVAEKANTEVNFGDIKNEIVQYAQSKPAISKPLSCDADPDFLRIWRQANSNEGTRPEPDTIPRVSPH